ncbi:thiamine phosphate synthase [Bacillus salacetis]|uniref:Thiamine-phosphate synthase n=1 Tax=Bacillus salacetis TaxID=2315464 RepID=A0A3A1R699_9BACI|nr:thiamine phosphate synthase [Bacillus salacetis]RIW38535.1 thiamine phosphate synthase [Bacillus salacetis]
MGSRNCTASGNPVKVLKDALSQGASIFQFREKGQGCLEGEGSERMAIKLQAVCREYNVPFIINDDVELALKINADGVHIGQEDGDPSLVRNRIGDKILGVSTHSVTEAAAAIEAGADYLGVGPMFATTTKPDTRTVSGPELISEMRRQGIQHPIVGIGGINEANAPDVIQAGADGVAVISCISSVHDPRTAASRMKAALDKARTSTH